MARRTGEQKSRDLVTSRLCLDQTTTMSRTITLEALQEWRFELDKQEAITVKLSSGTAECFGLELAHQVEYPFGDEARAAIFSWRGCELEMSLLPVLSSWLVGPLCSRFFMLALLCEIACSYHC